jgi:oligopeptide/dipeptide ABC transporter ATP-binding protein
MLLEVKDLVKHFPVTQGLLGRTVGQVRAVDGISFDLDADDVLGLVGESGCGKTTAGRCILRLMEPTSGSVCVNGDDILAMKGPALKILRRNLQVVFQDPMSSLNPRMTVRDIVAEPFTIHRMAKGRELNEKVAGLLDEVGLSRNYLNRYPHEFSGGQRQRIGIARALALRPKLIIADEPVSALDVSVQAQIINLLMDLKKEHGLSYLFIAHNLAVVRHISSRIAVMYLGKIVETGPSDAVCESPLHPYTRALLSAVPVPEVAAKAKRQILSGDVPSPSNPPPGCAFHTRCPLARPECREQAPGLVEKAPGRQVRCPFV